MEWEEIDGWNHRAKVFGGWVVKTSEPVFHLTEFQQGDGWDYRVSTCFVPDPSHEWVLDDSMKAS